MLGENTTRAMMYVAMTRGRDTNSAYLYQRATEQEYGPKAPRGAHVLDRGTAGHAARLLRAIIANHDQPTTAHDIAAKHRAPICPNASDVSTTDVQRRCNAGGQLTKAGKQTRTASPRP